MKTDFKCIQVTLLCLCSFIQVTRCDNIFKPQYERRPGKQHRALQRFFANSFNSKYNNGDSLLGDGQHGNFLYHSAMSALPYFGADNQQRHAPAKSLSKRSAFFNNQDEIYMNLMLQPLQIDSAYSSPHVPFLVTTKSTKATPTETQKPKRTRSTKAPEDTSAEGSTTKKATRRRQRKNEKRSGRSKTVRKQKTTETTQAVVATTTAKPAAPVVPRGPADRVAFFERYDLYTDGPVQTMTTTPAAVTAVLYM